MDLTYREAVQSCLIHTLWALAALWENQAAFWGDLTFLEAPATFAPWHEVIAQFPELAEEDTHA